MTVSESRENLVEAPGEDAKIKARTCSLAPIVEKSLTALEKRFLLYVERGDCASVRKHIEEYAGKPEEFSIDCVDPMNRSALIAAIENENVELITILIEKGILVKDALLHAIKEQYVEAVEILLEHEETIHKPGTPYSWEAVDRAQSTFTPDITPLMMAAHMNNYEIIKILLDRGATLPTPHDVRCGCDDCVESSEKDSLRHSQSRINAYRALSSPSLIALSSRDPLLTAFELSWELRRLSRMENEFREEYNEMRDQVQTFAAALLDHVRNSAELDTILNHDPEGESWNPGDRSTLERLKLAVKYKQKSFVAHPNIQQLLSKMWYDGLPGFRRLGRVSQLIEVGKMGAMFPVNSTICLLAPKSEKAELMSKPFVKFINNSASYAFFLLLLGAASQRVEYLVIELFGNDWMQEVLADWKRRERGSFPGLVESGCILYVISLICWELRSLWSDGLAEYMGDLWNIVDFVCNMFYTTWIALRATSIFISWREQWNGWDPYYPREEWDPFDPMLLSEGMFAAGMILSFLKLVHIFSVNPHLGPLQISLGRMMLDIVKFLIIYTLVLSAFGCGMNQLMGYYADLEMQKCYHLPDGSADFEGEEMACTIWRRFSNMFETSQSLFWASFGLVDLMAFELTGIKSFTRFWALLMFGSYSVINVIVLLNMLIAMMSNSYQIISEHSDVEWKYARSKLWMDYFEDGNVVPPPFNLVPGVDLFSKLFGGQRESKSLKVRNREKAQERHDVVARLLVRRFVTAEQRKRDEFGITEDDVMEVRQDISTLRFELIEILKSNGMKTPDLDKAGGALAGKKGKTMERRLMQDFKIGCVEGIVNEAITTEKGPKDIFGKIAQAIGKRKSTIKGERSEKKDWNAMAERQKSVRDPIGSVSAMEKRRSSQQSLRRYIVAKENSGVKDIDPNKLVEYNPKLKDMPPTARVAYAKFKTRKIKKEIKEHDKLEEAAEDDVFDDKKPKPSSVRPRPITKAGLSSLVKESVSSLKDVVVQVEPENSAAPARSQPSAKPPAKTTAPVQQSQAPPPASTQAKPHPATPPPSDLKPRERDGQRSPSTVPTSSTGTTVPASIPEKSISQPAAAASTPAPKPASTPAPKPSPASTPTPSPAPAAAPTPSPDPKPAPPAAPKAAPQKIQYSSDLEPGRGKSKVTGRMVQGWI